MHKSKLLVALVILLLIVTIGTACTAKQVGEPALAEVIVFEPVTPTPTAEHTPVTADGSLSIGEYDDMKDSVSSPEEGYSIPIVTDSSEAENTPLPSTPTPVTAPTATPKPISISTPAPTATAKPTTKSTATPLPTSTPTIPPVPTSTPAPTPVPALTPMPVATPAPVLTPAPTPIPEAPKARTICNICGADITGNVPAHGDGHLLNGEDFSYRVE